MTVQCELVLNVGGAIQNTFLCSYVMW